MDSKKLLSLLGAAGVVVHVAGNTVAMARTSKSPAALEQILQRDPLSDDASAAFDILADRASGKGGGHGNDSNNGNHGNGNNGNHGDGNNGNHGDGNDGHDDDDNHGGHHGDGNHGNGNGNDDDDHGHYDG